MEIGEGKLKARRKGQSYLLLTYQCLPAPSVIKLEEREFVVDSGASMHMSVRASKSPTTVVKKPTARC